jgi:preprotein translocase subunit SecF
MQDFYGNKYKKMMLIPTIIAIILLIVIFVLPLFLPGIFHGITPGVDLTGGNVLVLRSTKSITEAQLTGVLKENFSLKELKVSTIASPTGYGAWIQYSNDPIITNMEELISKANTSLNAENEEYSIAFSAAQPALHEYKGDFSKKLQDTISQKLGLGNNAEFQRREISPTLGAASFSSSIFITILGIIMIVIIIFIAFRQFVPSAAIIQAMLFDVLSGLAGMAFLNIPLSLTTLPALLMLIGYSVDTDILLTSRMLKGKDGTPAERATASMKTGLTMTGTTLGTLVVMLIVSYFYQIEVIYQISAILFFGLIGDIISTWLMNAPVLLWWLEKKEKARKY